LEELVLRHVLAFAAGRAIIDAYIYVRNGVVEEIGREPAPSYMASKAEPVDGTIAVPGFIDTHTHGIAGVDFTAELHKALETSKRYALHGVTSALPTTVAAPLEDLLEVCRAVKEIQQEWKPDYGARILGVHFEGPYINPKRVGAQNPAHIRSPSIEEAKRLVSKCRGVLKQITMAPEVPGALEAAKVFKEAGVVLSAGHSDATYDEAVKAIEAGFTKASHLFNGMREFHHREPGVVGAFLLDPRTFLEIIADFVHLHPAVVKIVVQLAGFDRVLLVSDSIAAADMSDGEYELWGLKVVVRNSIARLASTGSLAGSTLTLDRAFRNVVSLGFSPLEASIMASTTPARSIGVYGYVGAIERGFRADIVVLDKELRVRNVFIEGLRFA